MVRVLACRVLRLDRLTDASKTLKSISISGVASIATKGISALASLWIVTLIDPTKMGAITLGVAIYGILAIFKDFGLTTAVISKHDITDEFLSSANSLRIVISSALLAISVLFSYILPTLFGIPELREMMLIIGASIFIEAIGFLSYALLNRNLEFKKLARIDITSSLAMFSTVVVVALLGLPMFAVFFGLVASSSTKTGILLLFYTPKIKFVSWTFANRGLILFGAKLVSVGVVVTLWFSMNVFVLGAINIAALGFYGLAYQWAVTPADISSGTINRVMLPTYSALIRGSKPVFAGYMHTLRFLFVASFGVFVFLFFASPMLIRTLYNPSWEPTIPILLVLLIFALGRTLLEPAGSLILSLQRPGIILWTNMLNLALVSIFIFPVVGSYGATGCAALLAAVYLLHTCILWFIVLRIFQQSPKILIASIARPLIAASIALVIGMMIAFATSGIFWDLAALLIVTSAYLGLMYLIARKDLLQTLRYVGHAFGSHR